MKINTRPTYKWLVTYADGTTRVIYSHFREVLPSGAVAFYNSKLEGDTVVATEHLCVVSAYKWEDVTLNPQVSVGDKPTLGKAR